MRQFGATKAFTLLEILAVIVLLSILSVTVSSIVVAVENRAQGMVYKSNLATLNQALDQYRLIAGTNAALTSGTPAVNALALLQTPISRFGHTVSFLEPGKTYPAASLGVTGSGASYRFSRFHSYSRE